MNGQFNIYLQNQSVIQNYLIYIEAFNSIIWGGGDTQYLIDLSIY